MRTRLITVVLLSTGLVAGMCGAVANAQFEGEENLEITEFKMQPLDPGQSALTAPPLTQAGGNPNVALFWRFCGPGLPVSDVVPSSTPGRYIVTTDPADVNEVQAVAIGGSPTGGNFQLTFEGATTADIPWNATAADLQAALEALSTIGPGNVAVAGGPGPDARWLVTFQGALGGRDVTTLTATHTLTGGTNPAVSVEEAQTGGTHGLAPVNTVKMRGITTQPGANGVWFASRISATQFELTTFRRGPDLDERFAPGPYVQIARPGRDDYGCIGPQSGAKLADFKLELPPGFLGNPTALDACPTHLFIADSCSERSILGASVTETVIEGNDVTGEPTRVVTPVYNVQTFGLEPARLGTGQFPSEPAGPFAIKIDLRTTGDYGIDSALINIPKNLGGVPALITQIETVLCAQVPCRPVDAQRTESIVPLPPTRPFFRMPTSCKTATVRFEARSYKENSVTDAATDSFEVDGCDAVPFDTAVSVQPTETDQAGIAGSHQVSLEYPPYADAPIWQSNLRDADITLPEGLTLAAAGGEGLQACSFDQFGVNSAGKQISKAPAQCPEGSQVGTLSVTSPVLDFALGGKVFFGPVTGPGRPTASSPWKLFLLIEGAGLRIKLVGDVTVAEDGQIRNVFTTQPEVPFTRLDVSLRGSPRAILQNPQACGTHTGLADLTGWNIVGNPDPTTAKSITEPSITTTLPGTQCTDPKPFAPVVEEASGEPDKAGANSISKIVVSRGDGQQNLKGLHLILPPGAAGSLAAAPSCPLAQARAGTCPEATRIGTVRNTVGSGNSTLTVPGELYLSEAIVPGDAASIVARVPAKVGPIDLGQVVLQNRVFVRPSDNALEVVSVDAAGNPNAGIPSFLEGVPLPIRRIAILVDRPGFFLNPTGCDPRTLTAEFFGDEGAVSTSSIQLAATKCNELPFYPKLRLTAGAAGQTDQFDHPPFQATVTQRHGEADISNARVILPAILRPNVPFFNEPGALCNDAQAATRTCPAKSRVGNARAFSPLLPYPISGPVHIVQEVGAVLPKVYVYLRGPTGLEVLLKARNSFLQGRRIINTFESVPDLPQSFFELNLNGGRNGILNNFEDLCQASNSDRRFDATFTSHSGKRVTTRPRLRIRGCEESDLRAASLSGQSVRVSKKGVAKIKIRCKRKKKCSGRLVLRGKGVTGTGKVSVAGKKTRAVKVKFSRTEVKRLRKAKRLRTRASVTIGRSQAGRTSVTLIAPKKR